MPSLPFDQVVTPLLLRRFLLEAHVEDASGESIEPRFEGDVPPAPYYAIVKRDDGDLAVWHPYGPALDDMQMLFSHDVLRRLNKDLHHDGAWVIVWTNPAPPPPMDSLGVLVNPRARDYRRYALIWMDKDADPQFTIEWHEGITSDFKTFEDVLIAGAVSLMHRAESAWGLWEENRKMLELHKSGATYRRAKGERAPSIQ